MASKRDGVEHAPSRYNDIMTIYQYCMHVVDFTYCYFPFLSRLRVTKRTRTELYIPVHV